jgi:hypothetical protein
MPYNILIQHDQQHECAHEKRRGSKQQSLKAPNTIIKCTTYCYSQEGQASIIAIGKRRIDDHDDEAWPIPPRQSSSSCCSSRCRGFLCELRSSRSLPRWRPVRTISSNHVARASWLNGSRWMRCLRVHVCMHPLRYSITH